MSFKFSGATGARLRRTSGNVSSTGAFTKCWWVKRTANFTGMKFLVSLRPTGESTGHDLVVNDPSYTAYTPSLQANYASATAKADDPLSLSVWTFMAEVGSGANLSLKYWDGDAFVTATVGQTAFAPGIDLVGGYGSGVEFTGLVAHIRDWNAALTDSELEAEMLSETRVRTANFLSAKSGTGADLTAALTGEHGTAYTAGAGVTLDADQPTFDTFDGVVVSGASTISAEIPVVVGQRYNRILRSGDLSNSVWSKQGNEIVAGAAAAPAGFGTSQRIKINVNTGGVYQQVSGLPAGKHSAVVAVRRVDTDHVCFRHMASDFGSGAQGHFNLTTGAWGTTGNFGTVTDGEWKSRALGNGWYLIWIPATISGNRILEIYPITTNGTQIPAVDKHIDVCAWQLEEGALATYHKPTTATVAARSLSAVSASVAASTIAVGQSTTLTVQLLDDAGAPWDQFGPVALALSPSGIASYASIAGSVTDLSGRLSTLLTGDAEGSTSLTAQANGITSAPVAVTVAEEGAGVGQYVKILVESGWEGTAGWNVGVYQKHSTARFPTTKLFEASAQAFRLAQEAGQSRMDVAVPSGVTVTNGQIVEVVIENDNIAGRAVDGPGIFPAVVIGA